MGVDNIHDLFMPIVDGDMWVECRMLMESCRFYDIERVAELACAKIPSRTQDVDVENASLARSGADSWTVK